MLLRIMKAKEIKKDKQIVKGQNIRFSTDGHKILANFCKGKAYKLAAFCEIGALEKMRKEITESI